MKEYIRKRKIGDDSKIKVIRNNGDKNTFLEIEKEFGFVPVIINGTDILIGDNILIEVGDNIFKYPNGEVWGMTDTVLNALYEINE